MKKLAFVLAAVGTMAVAAPALAQDVHVRVGGPGWHGHRDHCRTVVTKRHTPRGMVVSKRRVCR